MAIAPLTPAEQEELNRLLDDEVKIKERIRIVNEKIALAQGSERDELEDMMELEELRLKMQGDSLKQLQKRQDFIDYEEDALESLASMSATALKSLNKEIAGGNILSNITARMIAMKEAEMGMDDEARAKSEKERSSLESITSSIIEKTEELAALKGEHAEEDSKIVEFEKSIAQLEGEAREEAERSLAVYKNITKQLERHEELHHQQEHLMEHVPQFLQDAMGFAKGLISAIAKLGPMALVFAAAGAALHSFIELDEAAEAFRKETGLSISQTKEIAHQAHEIEMAYRGAGVELKDVFDTVAALKTSFSDVANFSTETVAALTLMKTNFGVTAEHAADVQQIFEGIGGLSSETAANVQMQVADMAKMSGIAPDKVFKDIAENAEAASTFFHGDLNALTKNAIQAQRMGTSLKQQVSLAEKLLDFEAGIEDELVAATFVGGEFNLSRARALAMEGKLADANKETLSQLQRSGDFRKKDYFTQQQLAKAAGMSVEEINKQLNAQEKLNSLSAEEQKMAQEAIDKGLDITNINKEQLGDEVKKFAAQQEQQGQLTRLQNAFMGIAASIGGTLSPLLEGLVPILEMVLAPVQLIATAFSSIKDIIKGIFDPTTSLKDLFAEMGPLTTGIAVALGIAGAAVLGSMVPGLIRAGIAAAAQLPVLYSMAVAAITSASAATLGIGLVSIIGGIAAGVYAMKSASKAGDVLSPADGKTQVSTKEGGLFELSPNDDLVAAPGAAKAVVGGNGAPQMNLAVLSAPLNAMIAEIKGLRADMAAGKISVHMDGAKVTAGVSTQVNKSTRNNFAIA
jgi:hypothetical protein